MNKTLCALVAALAVGCGEETPVSHTVPPIQQPAEQTASKIALLPDSYAALATMSELSAVKASLERMVEVPKGISAERASWLRYNAWDKLKVELIGDELTMSIPFNATGVASLLGVKSPFDVGQLFYMQNSAEKTSGVGIVFHTTNDNLVYEVLRAVEKEYGKPQEMLSNGGMLYQHHAEWTSLEAPLRLIMVRGTSDTVSVGFLFPSSIKDSSPGQLIDIAPHGPQPKFIDAVILPERYAQLASLSSDKISNYFSKLQIADSKISEAQWRYLEKHRNASTGGYTPAASPGAFAQAYAFTDASDVADMLGVYEQTLATFVSWAGAQHKDGSAGDVEFQFVFARAAGAPVAKNAVTALRHLIGEPTRQDGDGKRRMSASWDVKLRYAPDITSCRIEGQGEEMKYSFSFKK